MPFPRWFAPAILALVLTGCGRRTLDLRIEQIRQYSHHEDRAYAADALRHIQHNYWTRHNGVWYGRMEDGTIIRLDAPRAEPAPLPSRAFYSGWHLQLTISSEDWRTYPPSPHEGPFQVVYAITRHSAANWNIAVSQGPVTSPLTHADALRIGPGG